MQGKGDIRVCDVMINKQKSTHQRMYMPMQLSAVVCYYSMMLNIMWWYTSNKEGGRALTVRRNKLNM